MITDLDTALFTWEDRNIPPKFMKNDLGEIGVDQMIELVWSEFGHGKPPTWEISEEDTNASLALIFENKIVFNKGWKISTYLVLHELTHLIIGDGKHTPRFFGAICDIYPQYMGMDREKMLENLRWCGFAVDEKWKEKTTIYWRIK